MGVCVCGCVCMWVCVCVCGCVFVKGRERLIKCTIDGDSFLFSRINILMGMHHNVFMLCSVATYKGYRRRGLL